MCEMSTTLEQIQELVQGMGLDPDVMQGLLMSLPYMSAEAQEHFLESLKGRQQMIDAEKEAERQQQIEAERQRQIAAEKYDREAYNAEGFDQFGFDRNGCDKTGVKFRVIARTDTVTSAHDPVVYGGHSIDVEIAYGFVKDLQGLYGIPTQNYMGYGYVDKGNYDTLFYLVYAADTPNIDKVSLAGSESFVVVH